MLFLKSWLEDYINLTDYTNSQLADIITRKSSEVEEIIEVTERFEGKVVVGKIQSLRKHPDADKLNIFDVNLGEKGLVQIVSAATNARDGLMVPVALDGAKLAGFTIQAKKLRGFESQGMCCGKSELLLETEHSAGLWELNAELGDDTFLGWSICEALPEYFPVEYVMDIKVLPDKIGVIGNHLGMAMEIATILEKPELLTGLATSLSSTDQLLSNIQNLSQKFQSSEATSFPVVFEDETGYSNSFNLFEFKISKPYSLNHVLQQRMQLTGRNLVGGLVDLSNYLLFDVGQPNHFFSLPKLQTMLNGQTANWNIQKLETDQTFAGLGQLKSTNLPSNLVVLKQNQETLHIPGISGGDSTKVDNEDTHFLVEIASFKPEEVGRNSFALNYRSDGSKIWAGGVNPARVLLSIVRLFALLGDNITYTQLSLAWINQLGNLPNLLALSQNLIEMEDNTVSIDIDYLVERLDGRDRNYWEEIIVQKLNQFGKYENNQLKLSQFYNRIRIPEDVLAEIVRLVQFENLQDQHLEFSTIPTPVSDFDKKQIWKNTLASFGFYETITRPFLAKEELLLSITKPNNTNESSIQPFQILNPYSSLQPYFRDSLLPSLLISAAKNIKRGEKEVNLFEAGQVYTLENGDKKEIYEIWGISIGDEVIRITSLIHDIAQMLQVEVKHETLPSSWSEIGQGVEYTLYSKSNPEKIYSSTHSTSNITQGDTIIHKINLVQINKKLKKQFGLPLSKSVWAFNIDFSEGISQLSVYPKYTEESEYPAINRSYSVLIPNTLIWSELSNLINQNLPETCRLQLQPTERIKADFTNYVIVNFAANLQSYDKTLEGHEVDKWEQDWQNKLFAKYPEAKLR